MAQILQHRRGTTAALQTERGSVGEIQIDTTKNTVIVMDGTTNGGHPLAKESDIPTAVSELSNDAGYITSAAVFSGSYTDLTNKPVLFDGAYSSLSGLPTLFDGAYASLSGLPDLSSLSTAVQPDTAPNFSAVTVDGSIDAASVNSNLFTGNNDVQFTSEAVATTGYSATLKGGQSTGDAGGAVYIEGGVGSTTNGDINIGTVNAGLTLIGRPGSTTEFYGTVSLGSATVTGLGYILVSDLKTLVASANTYAEFQTAVASL